MDDLDIFFNICKDIIRGTNFISSFNSILRICSTLKKSGKLSINSPGNKPIRVENSTIAYATPQTKHRLPEAFFSQTLKTQEYHFHAKTRVKELCCLLRNKSIIPACLKDILNAVVMPSAAYHYFFFVKLQTPRQIE
jgi:hypothetical protein